MRRAHSLAGNQECMGLDSSKKGCGEGYQATVDSAISHITHQQQCPEGVVQKGDTCNEEHETAAGFVAQCLLQEL